MNMSAEVLNAAISFQGTQRKGVKTPSAQLVLSDAMPGFFNEPEDTSPATSDTATQDYEAAVSMPTPQVSASDALAKGG